MEDQADHICVAVTHRYTVRLNRLTGGAASEVQPLSESLRSPLRARLIHPAHRDLSHIVNSSRVGEHPAGTGWDQIVEVLEIPDRLILAKEAPQTNATNSSAFHDKKRVSKGLSGREFVAKT
jgi:hypothetical protein